MDRMTLREERQLLSGALLVTLALLGLALLCSSGCATWQHTAARVVLGVEGGAKATRAFVAEPCAKAAMKLAVDKCIAAKDKACTPLARCEVALQALRSLESAVLVAKLAIQAGVERDAAMAITDAVQAVGVVARAVEGWK